MPSRRWIGMASSSVTQAASMMSSSATKHQPVLDAVVAPVGSSTMALMAPGPASSGMASGKTEISSR